MKLNLTDPVIRDAVAGFFADSTGVVVVKLNPALKITEYNTGFARLLPRGTDIEGRSISDFLSPSSRSRLPLEPSATLETKLSFIADQTASMLVDCHISRTGDQHIIIGSRAILTNSDVVEKLSKLTNELANMARELDREKHALEEAQAKIKVLSGILPICSYCHKIRDKNDNWNRIEAYISEHSESDFSHGICPECMEKWLKENDV